MHEKEMCFPRLIFAAVAVVLIGTLASGAALLPADEVEAMKRSAIVLGKTDWDFSVDPCNTGQNSTWVSGPDMNLTCDCTFDNNSVCHIAYVLQEQGNLLELVDPRLGSNYHEKEAMRMLNLAFLCTNPSPTLRPSMSSVVSMLEGKIPVQAALIKRRSMDEDLRFKAFERLTQDSQTQFSTYSQDSQAERSMSRDGPWIDSSFSIQSKDELADSSSTKHLLLDLDDVNLK
ncbi:hypothetical protein RJ639_014523 [Escallonia herrerae]|uniref:Uncharacterized protein n=1 Tax=Escallonia herrerae TaxID=1293975 RepID=A0AA88VJ94_9ASTE|nr:hypothetical protein RJ639_014523 [Escallonia herrerae]